MRTKMRDTLLFRAFILALLINALASGAGMLGEMAKPLRILGYVAQAVAAPPAFLIGRFIRPDGSSLIAVVTAGVEGLIFSIVFYTAVIWFVLVFLDRSRQSQTN
jgi:hypothetical protein